MMPRGKKSNNPSFGLARYQDPEHLPINVNMNAEVNPFGPAQYNVNVANNDIEGCCGHICNGCMGASCSDMCALISRLLLIIGMLAVCIILVAAGVNGFIQDNEDGTAERVFNTTNRYEPNGAYTHAANAYMSVMITRVIVMVAAGAIGIACLVVLSVAAKWLCCGTNKHTYTEV